MEGEYEIQLKDDAEPFLLSTPQSRDPSTQKRAPGAREDGENGGYYEGGATNRLLLWYGGCAQEQLTGQNLHGSDKAQSECETLEASTPCGRPNASAICGSASIHEIRCYM